MEFSRNVAPALLGALLLSTAAVAEDAPQPAAPADTADAAAPVADVADPVAPAAEADAPEAPSLPALVIAAAAAPEAESLSERLSARLDELVASGELSTETAAKVRALVLELAAASPVAAAPSPALLELEALNSTAAAPELLELRILESGSPLALAAPDAHIVYGQQLAPEALAQLELELQGHALALSDTALAEAELEKLNIELQEVQGQELSEEALLELQNLYQLPALVEGQKLDAAASNLAELAAKELLELHIQPLAPEALAELESLSVYALPGAAVAAPALAEQAARELEIYARGHLAGAAGLPEGLAVVQGFPLGDDQALKIELERAAGLPAASAGSLESALTPGILLGIQGLQNGDEDKTRAAALLLAMQLLAAEDDSLRELLPEDLRKLSSDDLVGRLKLKDGWENDLQRLGDRLSVMLKGFLRNNSKK
ncbi:hypothetical protein IT575_06770 [bacterium]|nr:hypothetical protein [bacterium]